MLLIRYGPVGPHDRRRGLRNSSQEDTSNNNTNIINTNTSNKQY